MNEIKLINKIFSNENIRVKIILHFDKNKKKPLSMTRDSFMKMCKEYSVDIEPSILFHFFDQVGINIGIMPSRDGGFWSSRIYTRENLTISNDYTSRKDATFGALIKAIEIFNNK